MPASRQLGAPRLHVQTGPHPQQLHSLEIGPEQAMVEVLPGQQAVELTGPSTQSYSRNERETTLNIARSSVSPTLHGCWHGLPHLSGKATNARSYHCVPMQNSVL